VEKNWISLKEFMRRNNMGYDAAIRLINSGKVEYQKINSQYKIKVGSNRNEKFIEELIRENAQLKSIISSLKAILKEVNSNE